MISAEVWQAIRNGLTCDITTYGRKSGLPRRIEIWYFVVDGQIYLSGTPGPRDWLANLQANPQMILHIKEGAQADLSAHAEIIADPTVRRQVMAAIMAQNAWFREQPSDLEAWVAGSPLVRVGVAS